jgi:hypothetical protein
LFFVIRDFFRLHAEAARAAIHRRCDARGRRPRQGRAVKSIVIEGTGVNYNLGQDMKPEAATQQFAITGYKREIDVEQGGSASSRRARRSSPTSRARSRRRRSGARRRHRVQRRRQRRGHAACTCTASAIAARIFHHPITALKRRPSRSPRSRTCARSARAPGRLSPSAIALDDDDRCGGLPLSISSKTYNPNLGDVVVTTTFADYQDVKA